MRPRLTFPVSLLFALAGLSAGCDGKPQVRHQPGDRTVTPGQTETWAFDKDAAGRPPAGAEVFGGTGEVRAEADAPSQPNVLCQSATAEDFPAVRLGAAIYTDLTAAVRFKPISGKDDQAAGIIFRVQDKDNYYIVRANALEDNLIFFRYASGKRTTLKEGAVKVPSGEWQELRLEVEGDHFRGFLNDKQIVEATDGAYKAGGVGLWTKADSVTLFDDLRVTAK
jgi:hypothetical protein